MCAAASLTFRIILRLRTAVGGVLEMVGIDVGLVVRRADGLLYQRFVDVSGGEPDENVSIQANDTNSAFCNASI